MYSTVIAVYRKNRITVKRSYPYSFLIQRLLTGIGTLLFPLLIYFYVFEGNISYDFYGVNQTFNYVEYIVIGAAIYIGTFSTLMSVSRCLITEIREGTIDCFLLSPASRFGYFLGIYIEQFIRSCSEFIAILFFGFLFGAVFSIKELFILFSMFILCSISSFSIAILISSIMIYTRDTYIIQNTILYALEFLCGILFPIEYLPKYIAFLSNLIPTTYVIKISRMLILLHTSFSDTIILIALLLILSVVYLFIGFYCFVKQEKKIIEEVLA